MATADNKVVILVHSHHNKVGIQVLPVAGIPVHPHHNRVGMAKDPEPLLLKVGTEDIQVLPVVVILVHPHNNSKVDMPKGQEHLLPKGEDHMDLLLQALILKLNNGLMQLIKIDPDKFLHKNCKKHWLMEIGPILVKRHAD